MMTMTCLIGLPEVVRDVVVDVLRTVEVEVANDVSVDVE